MGIRWGFTTMNTGERFTRISLPTYLVLLQDHLQHACHNCQKCWRYLLAELWESQGRDSNLCDPQEQTMTTEQNEELLLTDYSRTRRRGLEYLTTTLETLVSVNIAACYTTDNTFLLLAARFLTQQNLSLAACLFVNFLSILFHAISASPTGSTYTKGYLHGSIIIDFIGELGPISKSRLVLQDITIICGQILLLALQEEVERTKTGKQLQPSAQIDLESGLEGPHADIGDEDGIELQPLTPREHDVDGAQPQDNTGPPHTPAPVFAGMDCIGTIDLWQNLKALAQRPSSTSPSTSALEEAGVLGRLLSQIAAARARTVAS